MDLNLEIPFQEEHWILNQARKEGAIRLSHIQAFFPEAQHGSRLEFDHAPFEGWMIVCLRDEVFVRFVSEVAANVNLASQSPSA